MKIREDSQDLFNEPIWNLVGFIMSWLFWQLMFQKTSQKMTVHWNNIWIIFKKVIQSVERKGLLGSFDMLGLHEIEQSEKNHRYSKTFRRIAYHKTNY